MADKLFTVDVATTPKRGQDMSGFAPKFADYGLVVLNYTGDAWPVATTVDPSVQILEP